VSAANPIPPRPEPVSVTPEIPRDPDQISMLSAVSAVLRHRGLVAGVVALCLLAGAALALLPRRQYEVTSSFMPQARKTPSGLSGLAAQFGLSLPSVEGRESPLFYVDLIQSRHILGSLAEAAYTIETDTGRASGNLIQLYRIKGKTPARRRDAAIKMLAKNVTAAADPKTSVVEMKVTARTPDLALLLSQQLLSLISRYNLESRQSQASAERKFTERRLEEVKRDFREAENRLQAFLQRNRDYRNSPELLFQFDRLNRDVNMQDQVYTTLAQAYEQAKIEEVRDTPVLTIVDPPELPVRPRSRGLLKIELLTLLLGVVLGVTLALTKDVLDSSKTGHREELRELAALRQATLDDLIHPWRPLQRLVRGTASRR
jgi:uncharacterized protein involved in exopolysaccharide biosynthesis